MTGAKSSARYGYEQQLLCLRACSFPPGHPLNPATLSSKEMDKSSPDLSLTRSTSHQRRTNTPSILPQQLQSHLFDAFISGETADISVSVHGAWNATYSLHRIVLTQAVRRFSGLVRQTAAVQ